MKYIVGSACVFLESRESGSRIKIFGGENKLRAAEKFFWMLVQC